jgi:hypothetical protein
MRNFLVSFRGCSARWTYHRGPSKRARLDETDDDDDDDASEEEVIIVKSELPVVFLNLGKLANSPSLRKTSRTTSHQGSTHAAQGPNP